MRDGNLGIWGIAVCPTKFYLPDLSNMYVMLPLQILNSCFLGRSRALSMTFDGQPNQVMTQDARTSVWPPMTLSGNKTPKNLKERSFVWQDACDPPSMALQWRSNQRPGPDTQKLWRPPPQNIYRINQFGFNLAALPFDPCHRNLTKSASQTEELKRKWTFLHFCN